MGGQRLVYGESGGRIKVQESGYMEEGSGVMGLPYKEAHRLVMVRVHGWSIRRIGEAHRLVKVRAHGGDKEDWRGVMVRVHGVKYKEDWRGP